MDEKKTCIHCERQIDAVARICPFCNWDQTASPSRRVSAAQSAAYKPPPPERRWRGKILGIGAFIALVIASFAVGTVIHGFDVPEKKDEKTATTGTVATTTAPKRMSPAADITLVPVGDNSAEPPVTSAPLPNQERGVPTEAQRSDATALPSEQYVRIAAAAKTAQKPTATVDPRLIGGTAYGNEPPLRRNTPAPAPAASVATGSDSAPVTHAVEVRRTNPEPLSQPMPSIQLPHSMTASLMLTVGPDGHVKEVKVLQSIPEIGRLISAAQGWTFKPGTENGVPVTANFKVDVSFNGND